jgi:hypothetical protein
MNAPAEFKLIVLITVLIALVSVYTLVKYLWKQPLQNGTGFFLGVAVPVGFYDGPGKTWLKSYHAMLVVLHLVLAIFFVVCFALGRWDLIPLCGFYALLYTAAMRTFQAWTRHRLGANPPVRAVALALESRRLGDYISWQQEALMTAVIASSWWLLLTRGGAHVDWIFPLIVTWMVLGLIPGKILAVGSGYPLPAERAEEHYQYQDAMRRSWINMNTANAWCFLVVLFGVALGRAWSPIRSLPWFLWGTIGIFIAVWGYSMILSFRRMRLAKTMGRDLLPPGSFATPLRHASRPWMGAPFKVWFAIWAGGIVAMILYSQFR